MTEEDWHTSLERNTACSFTRRLSYDVDESFTNKSTTCFMILKTELEQSLTPMSFTVKVAPLDQTPSSPDSHDRHLRRGKV